MMNKNELVAHLRLCCQGTPLGNTKKDRGIIQEIKPIGNMLKGIGEYFLVDAGVWEDGEVESLEGDFVFLHIWCLKRVRHRRIK